MISCSLDPMTATSMLSIVRTGGLRWKHQTEGMVHATPAIVGDLAFIAGCDEVFRAIRISDGKQVYEIKIGAYTGASPVIDGDRAYFGTFNYEVVALDLKDRRFSGGSTIRSGISPSIPRRLFSVIGSFSVAGTSSSARSTGQPGRKSGILLLAAASIHLPR